MLVRKRGAGRMRLRAFGRESRCRVRGKTGMPHGTETDGFWRTGPLFERPGSLSENDSEAVASGVQFVPYLPAKVFATTLHY